MSKTILAAGLALVAALLAGACGGGGGGGGGGGAGGPKGFRVRNVEPRDGAAGVPNDAGITIHLSERVDPDTVSEATLALTRDPDPAPLSGYREISDDGLRVTFHPSPWLDTSTTYTVRVSGELGSQTGEVLPGGFVSQFTTGPWPSPRPVVQAEFREVPERMRQGRSSHTATLLPSGFVLLAGGYTSIDSVTASAELYDPVRDEFLDAGAMETARGNHTATLLESGLVLIAGGERAEDVRGTATAELFSPATLQFLSTGSMEVERTVHTATRLPDGRVLVTGGKTLGPGGVSVWHDTAEIYDPATGTWSRTAGDMTEPRAWHTATLLPSGEVLIAGGSPSGTAEIFDPATERFRAVECPMVGVRYLHRAVLLPGGVVFITGGGVKTGELFDPATERFTATGNGDSNQRSAATVFEFRPGEVLVLGGMDFSVNFVHATMEQYDAAYGPGGRYFHVPALPEHGVVLPEPLAFSAVAPLPGGKSWLITGGLGPSETEPDLDTALVFTPTVE